MTGRVLQIDWWSSALSGMSCAMTSVLQARHNEEVNFDWLDYRVISQHNSLHQQQPGTTGFLDKKNNKHIQPVVFLLQMKAW